MNWDDRLASGTANVLLLAPIALEVAASIALPELTNTRDVVSATTRSGYASWLNYLQFAAFGSMVALAFYAGYRQGTPLVTMLSHALARDASLKRKWRTALQLLIVTAAAAYLVNASVSTIDHPLTDDFHEGEYLGFIPHLRAHGGLAGAMTVHGPGVDLLPAYAAIAFAGPDNGIAVARAAYALLRVAAVLAAFAGIAMLCRLLAPRRPSAHWGLGALFAILVFGTALRVGAWPGEPPLHKPLNPRDTAYLVQLALVLAFSVAKHLRPAARHSGIWAALLVGATLPWAWLYSYDRGLYGIAFVVLVSVPILLSPWRATWLSGLAGGALVGAALLLLQLPTADLAAAANQIRFWIAHGRDLWSYRGTPGAGDLWIVLLLTGASATLILALVATWRTSQGAHASMIVREPALVVMLCASLPGLRMAIERGDASHVAWAVTPAWMLASALVARVACTRASEGGPEARAVVGILQSVLVGLAMPLFDPIAAVRHVERFAQATATHDSQILSPAQREAREAMATAVGASPCFVTLTNEGTWYYILDRPSCSRFHQVTNARPVAAQEEVVRAIESTRPEWVLFSNKAWSNVVDGISLFNASPEIAAHVLSHYEPGRVVGDNWFWRRAAQLDWRDERIGRVTSHPTDVSRTHDARIEGMVPPESTRMEPRALMLTEGEHRRPLWADRPDPSAWRAGTWSASIPTAALSLGGHRLQAWAHFEAPSRWVRLGDEIDLVVR